MEAWVGILIGGLLSGGGIGAVLVFVATRKRDSRTDIAERFDDASQLAKYIDERVEAKVGPLRAELEKVKAESHELRDAVREHLTQLWAWDQRGRAGSLPMLPVKILRQLGLAYLVHLPEEDTEPIHPNEKDTP